MAEGLLGMQCVEIVVRVLCPPAKTVLLRRRGRALQLDAKHLPKLLHQHRRDLSHAHCVYEQLATDHRHAPSRPSSRDSDVTPLSRMPHGTMCWYQPRSTLQFSANPCVTTNRDAATPAN